MTTTTTDQDAYVRELGDGPVQLGSILFTLVEPHAGWEVAYNRWYERDHYYDGCLVGPHTLAGARFVAPRRHKELRHVADGFLTGDPLDGSYLSLYWVLAGKREEWNRWAYRQFRWLHDQGRMFPHREHVHTLLYDHDWAHHRDDDPVPAALALDHRYAGVVATIGEAAADVGRPGLDAWLRDDHLPWLQADGPVASTLSFTGVPLLVDAEGVAKDEGSHLRFLHLSFVDTDPADVWDERFADQPRRFADAGVGHVLWQGPFIPTVPGTDRYADELR